MRIPARLSVIALLAIGLYLPADRLTRAQQPGTVTVRPRVATPLVTVDRNRVPLGDLVTFSLTPAGVVMNSRYKVTIYFGDGERCAFRDDPKCQVVRQTEIVHLYRKPANYTYSILVEPSSPTPTPTPAPALPSVKLSAMPTSVEINCPVDFAAQLSHSYPNIKYRFVFDDGSQTGWQSESKTTHEYGTPNTYKAYVDIGVGNGGAIKQVGGSPRQRIQVTQPSTITVKLIASPTSIEVAKPVTFTAETNSRGPNVRYRFDFGDQSALTGWQASPQSKHDYASGGNYAARVDVQVISSRCVTQPATSNPVSIEVNSSRPPAKLSVDLEVIPKSVPQGVPVYFGALASPSNAKNRYRFNFGDGSLPSDWSSEPRQTHIYSLAGTYPAFVEMATANDEPWAASAQKRVRVTPIGPPINPPKNENSNTNANGNANGNSNTNANGNANANANMNTNGNLNTNSNANANVNTNGSASMNSNGSASMNSNATNANSSALAGPVEPPTDWWKYIIIAAIILFAGYQASAYLFPPRPTFVPKADAGDSRVGGDKPLAIDLQVDVDPNVEGGEFKLDTKGGSLIKSERSSDD